MTIATTDYIIAYCLFAVFYAGCLHKTAENMGGKIPTALMVLLAALWPATMAYGLGCITVGRITKKDKPNG